MHEPVQPTSAPLMTSPKRFVYVKLRPDKKIMELAMSILEDTLYALSLCTCISCVFTSTCIHVIGIHTLNRV